MNPNTEDDVQAALGPNARRIKLEQVLWAECKEVATFLATTEAGPVTLAGLRFAGRPCGTEGADETLFPEFVFGAGELADLINMAAAAASHVWGPAFNIVLHDRAKEMGLISEQVNVGGYL